MRPCVDSFSDITRDNHYHISLLWFTINQCKFINSSVLPAEKLPFQSLCCRPDGLDFLSKRLLNIVGGCGCSCSCCIFGFICFIINITSDLVSISLSLFLGVKLWLLRLGRRTGRSSVVWLVSSGQRMDGNVLWGWWGSHGMDSKGEVCRCSHHLEIRTECSAGHSLPSTRPPGQ